MRKGKPGLLLWVVGLLTWIPLAVAQTQKGGQSSQSQGGGQGVQGAQSQGGQSMPGLSYTEGEWWGLELPNVTNSKLSLKEGRAVVCYRLMPGNSATQPFVLQQLIQRDVESTGFYRPCGYGETDSGGQKICQKEEKKEKKGSPPFDGHWTPCTELQSDNPLLMNQELVVGIDLSELGKLGINYDQIKLLNLNVTNQQGASINPTPLRATFPSTGASGAGGGVVGSPGAANSTKEGGAYFGWGYVGHRPPNGGHAKRWEPNTEYSVGDVLADASGTNFYVLRCFPVDDVRGCRKLYMQSQKIYAQSPGAKGVVYKSGEQPTDPFPEFMVSDWILDGEVVWQEMYRPVTKASDHPHANYWQAQKSQYRAGDEICVLRVKGDQLPFAEDLTAIGVESGERKCTEIEVRLKTLRIPCIVNQIRTDNASDCYYLQYYVAIRGGVSGVAARDLLSYTFIPRTVYLGWPYKLPGDIIPTFNVTLGYTPPTPGGAWRPNTLYPQGSVVTRRESNGHYYVALAGGVSGFAPNEPQFMATPAQTFEDGALTWLDSGTSTPSVPTGVGTGGTTGNPSGSATGKAQLRMDSTHYQVGDVVLDPNNGHYYTVLSSSEGLSAPAPTDNSLDPFKKQGAYTVTDGDLIWKDLGQPAINTDPWMPNHPYKKDMKVSTNGHDYQVLRILGGMSGEKKRDFPVTQYETVVDPETIYCENTSKGPCDTKLQWLDLGEARPNAASTKLWTPDTTYTCGEIIFVADVGNGRYFKAKIDGRSGNSLSLKDTSPFPATSVLQWLDLGEAKPNAASTKLWTPDTTYTCGEIIFVPGVGNGRYFKARNDGRSGKSLPFQEISPPFPVTWQDSGTTAPASVSAAPPSDQNVTLINLTLPQAHSLSYFNITSGVVVGLSRSPTFGFVPAASAAGYGQSLPSGYTAGSGPAPTATTLYLDPGTGCTVSGTAGAPGATVWQCPVKTGYATNQVDPVLALSGYIFPLDAERPFHYKGWRDWVPAPGVGISLAHPTSNFYLGLSNEAFVRNLQFFYGAAFYSTSLALGPPATQPVWSGTGTAPAVSTETGFHHSFFIGVTFNLSGFIQSLFGGGGGK